MKIHYPAEAEDNCQKFLSQAGLICTFMHNLQAEDMARFSIWDSNPLKLYLTEWSFFFWVTWEVHSNGEQSQRS